MATSAEILEAEKLALIRELNGLGGDIPPDQRAKLVQALEAKLAFVDSELQKAIEKQKLEEETNRLRDDVLASAEAAMMADYVSTHTSFDWSQRVTTQITPDMGDQTITLPPLQQGQFHYLDIEPRGEGAAPRTIRVESEEATSVVIPGARAADDRTTVASGPRVDSMVALEHNEGRGRDITLECGRRHPRRVRMSGPNGGDQHTVAEGDNVRLAERNPDPPAGTGQVTAVDHTNEEAVRRYVQNTGSRSLLVSDTIQHEGREYQFATTYTRQEDGTVAIEHKIFDPVTGQMRNLTEQEHAILEQHHRCSGDPSHTHEHEHGHEGPHPRGEQKPPEKPKAEGEPESTSILGTLTGLVTSGIQKVVGFTSDVTSWVTNMIKGGDKSDAVYTQNDKGEWVKVTDDDFKAKSAEQKPDAPMPDKSEVAGLGESLKGTFRGEVSEAPKVSNAPAKAAGSPGQAPAMK